MTRPLESIERIRWMLALVAAATLSMGAALALHQWQPPSIQAPPTAAGSGALGSSASLDPRNGSTHFDPTTPNA